MKKILITGTNSYIGTSFERYMRTHKDILSIDTLDMIDGTWREKSFSGYDVVFHVAGIAHADTGRISEETKALYYKINTDLTAETAQKAKAEGVHQFIFMSSAIVYGDSAPIGENKIITRDTKPVPANFYGDSKLKAEQAILPLQDSSFNVVVLRPPMIYGKGSKGNYPKLSRMARTLPVFPRVNNARSMLHIDNLCEFIRLMIQNEEKGIFHPQNAEYSNTSELVQMIAVTHGRTMYLVLGLQGLLKLASHACGLINKAFGSFCYDMALSDYPQNYRVVALPQSIMLTETASAEADAQ